MFLIFLTRRNVSLQKFGEHRRPHSEACGGLACMAYRKDNSAFHLTNYHICIIYVKQSSMQILFPDLQRALMIVAHKRVCQD